MSRSRRLSESYRLVLVCITTGIALMAAEARAEEKRYAVVVGNNVGNPQDGELLYAERDATRFATVLRNYGGFDAANTLVLLGNSKTEVKRAISRVNARIATDAPGKAILLVYYSGHADAAGLHPGPGTLLYRDLRRMLEQSKASVRVLVLDGCRSGALTRVKGARRVEEFEIQGQAKVEGLVIISSSTAGEDSHESSRLKASFFSHHFTNALVGAGDDDKNGTVTLSEAYRYAYRNTLRDSGRTSQLQHPTYSFDLKGRNDLPMTFPARETRGARLKLARSGTYLVFRESEDGELVAEVGVKSAGATLLLPPERYFVRRRAASHYAEYKVRLRQGKTTDLNTLEARHVRYARLVRKGGSTVGPSHVAYSLASGRTEIIDGLGSSPGVVLGYQLDLPVVSVGLRGRLNTGRQRSFSSALQSRHTDYGAQVTAQHFVDWQRTSLGLGLVGEVTIHEQSFRGNVVAEGRRALGYGFGALASLHRELGTQLVFRLEAGPMTYRMPVADVMGGAEVGRSSETALALWAAAGLGWMF